MTCTIETKQIKQLLSRVFNPNINQTPKETSVVISGLADSFTARPLLLNFLMKNWEFLTKQ